MNKKFILILLIAVIIVSGCTSQNSGTQQPTTINMAGNKMEIMNKVYAAIANVKSYTYDFESMAKENDNILIIGIHGEIDRENQRARISTTDPITGQTAALYLIGNDTYTQVGDRWIKATNPASWVQNDQYQILGSSISSSTDISEEMHDGKMQYVMHTSTLMPMASASQLSNIKITLWVDKDTFLITTAVWQLTVANQSQVAQLNLTGHFANYNVPISIELPQEAQQIVSATIVSASGKQIRIKNNSPKTITNQDIIIMVSNIPVQCVWEGMPLAPQGTATCSLAQNCVSGEKIMMAAGNSYDQTICV